ncbi:hypothetical protein [Streptomyces sp. enrichment culture]|uniref:hypothetical protein n=1 Tax=Streptomyces sp. enrichment culture TaxID=1795815 RepID=UPI003F548065
MRSPRGRLARNTPGCRTHRWPSAALAGPALARALPPSGARRAWSNPRRHRLVADDGTVAKLSAPSTTPYDTGPPVGEIRRHRGCLRRVFLGYAPVPHDQGGGEATTPVRFTHRSGPPAAGTVSRA